MEHDDDENVNKKNGTPFSPEIEALDKEIISLTKNKGKTDELCKKVNLVYDQVQSWCSKVIAKVDQ